MFEPELLALPRPPFGVISDGVIGSLPLTVPPGRLKVSSEGIGSTETGSRLPPRSPTHGGFMKPHSRCVAITCPDGSTIEVFVVNWQGLFRASVINFLHKAPFGPATPSVR